MRPIFTIHAGEFVFGEYVEKNNKQLTLWVPTKDKGIDFLVAGPSNKKVVSVQVKMSHDYRPIHATSNFERMLLAAGWFKFSYSALDKSTADIWSLVLVSHERKSKPVFINIPPHILLQKLFDTHGKQKDYHLYPWVTKNKVCLEGRGISKAEKASFVEGSFKLGSRDLTAFLEEWSFLEKLSVI